MAEYVYEPTKWNEMAKPVDGGKNTYQSKSWNPTSKKWGPWTKDGPAPVWFSEANATNWTESMICKTKDLFYEAKLNECIAKGTRWPSRSTTANTTGPPSSGLSTSPPLSKK